MSENGTNLVVIQNYVPKYKVGDKVRLKGSGPILTITKSTTDRSEVEATWFASRSAIHSVTLHQDAFEHVKSSRRKKNGRTVSK